MNVLCRRSWHFLVIIYFVVLIVADGLAGGQNADVDGANDARDDDGNENDDVNENVAANKKGVIARKESDAGANDADNQKAAEDDDDAVKDADKELEKEEKDEAGAGKKKGTQDDNDDEDEKADKETAGNAADTDKDDDDDADGDTDKDQAPEKGLKEAPGGGQDAKTGRDKEDKEEDDEGDGDGETDKEQTPEKGVKEAAAGGQDAKPGPDKTSVSGASNAKGEAAGPGSMSLSPTAFKDTVTVETSSHFMPYFITLTVVIVMLYVVYHKRNLIFALLLEGKRSNGSRRRGNSGSGVEYQQLSTAEAGLSGVDSGKSDTGKGFVY